MGACLSPKMRILSLPQCLYMINVAYASLGLRLIVECSYHSNAPFGVLVNEHIPCLSLKCMNFAVGALSLRCWVMDEILGTNHYGFAGFLWLGWSGGWGRPNYDPLFHTILYFGSFLLSLTIIGLFGFIHWTLEPNQSRP